MKYDKALGKIRMKKALVTGGAGFIGSHLAKRLLKVGWSVDIVDNLSTGFQENIPAGAKFIFLDLSTDDFVKKIPVDNYDAVFHLAAQSSGEISFDNPSYDLKTNCHSTLLLLNWCHKNNIKRFIYTSSMSVYGDQETQPVSEDMIPRPKSFYGVGKLASEGYVNVYSHIGINTTSLRLFNVYGPGQNMKNMRQGMVSIYMAYILKKEPIVIKGAPNRFRDIVYVDDVVDCYIKCLENPASYGKTYNVGTGKKTTVKELIHAELQAFGYDPETYPIKFEPSTPGDTFGIYADLDMIKQEIGWMSKIGLKDGLKEMFEWVSKSSH